MLDGESETDLAAFDKHKIFSQRGAFIALLPKASLEDVSDVPISIMDWKTRAGKRVFHATFAAEAQAVQVTLLVWHTI